MQLTKIYIDIEKVEFSDRTYVDSQSGTLYICKAELLAAIADPTFSRVEIDAAHPGERCRIMGVGDVVQPMLKLGDEDATFPGYIGEMRLAGSGETLVLRGVAVTEVLETDLPYPAVIDTFGEGAEQTVLGDLIHVTIDAFPADWASAEEYLIAMNRASKKAAKFLAQAAKGADFHWGEDFTLTRDPAELEGLPRVAYAFGAFSHATLTDPLFYGDSFFASVPTIVHPNEFLDGAYLNRNYPQLDNADPSFVTQNHPVISELYAHHGHTLNFVGVVLTNEPHAVESKQRNAMITARLVRDVLKADGCIITKEGGGHPQVDMSLICDLLENSGVKTVMGIAEFLSANNGTYEQLLFTTKNADAMVSEGCQMPFEFPPAERVIGSCPLFAHPGYGPPGRVDPLAGFIHRNRSVRGMMSQTGATYWATKRI